MNDKRTSETGGTDEFSGQAGISKEAAGSPRAGTNPTGQSPQGTGRGEPGGAESEMAGGETSRPGQAGEGKGGPGDRTNLSGMGGPEKSNWGQHPDRTDDSES